MISVVEDIAEKPCHFLAGVGPQLALRLAELHLHTVQDIWFHLPLRYQDRTRLHPLRTLIPGQSVLIEAEIVTRQLPKGGKTRLLCRVSDQTGVLALRFFHLAAHQINTLVPGVRVRCFGEVRLGSMGFEMMHPEYQVVQPGTPLAQSLTPIYPATEGLHQGHLRKITDSALQLLMEYAPIDYLARWHKLPLLNALQYVHRPPVDADVGALLQGIHPCQKRLAVEELLAHRLALLDKRQVRKTHRATPFFTLEENAFLQHLPFQLTAAQRRVMKEVAHDLQQTRPMLRLVQGDVGSGKTVIAAYAAWCAVRSGHQVAFMAPTEILAEQHEQTVRQWFSTLNKQICYLTGRLTAKEKATALSAIQAGEASIIIGTQALFQEKVIFKNLHLVIIDEQHRFGVNERLSLRNKSNPTEVAHQLILTATPIPRTLAMTVYADIDTSVLDELPPGRTPIKTVLIDHARRQAVMERVRVTCLQGQQAYWVCTLIEESEMLRAEAAEKTVEMLMQALPELKIALLHGRMKTQEKEKIMQDFKARVYHLLVATTVIEVGVDVPNATLMIVENAERLGLSQLHQLRGRVGRGDQSSFCVLLYQSPLSLDARSRLQFLRECHDGFLLAEKDLEMRGPGDVLGTRQSGEVQFRIADMRRDHALMNEVAVLAEQVWEHDPASAAALIARWRGTALVFKEV